MRRRITLGFISAIILALSACSTSKLAQQPSISDDVYATAAKAKEQPEPTRKDPDYRTEEQLYGGKDYYDDYRDDYYDDYSSRIRRFYYHRPWGGYYDNWYSYRYDPWYDYYGYNHWYSPGLSLYIGPRSWYYDNYYWGYYGSPYYSRFWGPYSYYNYYPGYGFGGYYPYSYYGRPVYASPNYRTRPNRETGLGAGGGSGIYNNAVPGRGSAGTAGYSRPDRLSPRGDDRISSRPSSNTSEQPASRPSRSGRNDEYRPPRESSAPRQEPSRPVEYSRPERSSSPGSYGGGYSGGSSGSGSSGSGSSGSSGGSSRPSRGN